MKVTVSLFCFLIAIICFVVAAIRPIAALVSQIDFMDLGFAFVVAGWVTA